MNRLREIIEHYRLVILTLICLSLGSACQSTEPGASPSDPSLDTNVDISKLSSWQIVPGLEGGEIGSLRWQNGTLYVKASGSGIYEWLGADSGFDLMFENRGLAVARISMISKLGGLASNGRLLFVNAGEQGDSVVYSDGDAWVISEQEGRNLLAADDLIYLRRVGGVDVSHDGENWSTLVPFEAEIDENLFIHGSFAVSEDESKVYAINENGLYVARVADGIWQRLRIPSWFEGLEDVLESRPRAVWISPYDGKIYVVGDADHLFVSSDDLNWQKILDHTEIKDLTIDPDTGRIYVLAGNAYYQDPGESEWHELALADVSLNELVIADGMVWAATSDGLWSYDPNSAVWLQYSRAGLHIKNFSTLLYQDGTLLAQLALNDTFCGSDFCQRVYPVYRRENDGTWVEEMRFTPLVKPFQVGGRPSGAPEVITEFINLTLSGVPITIASGPSGVYIYEASMGWQLWNLGLPTHAIADFAYDSQSKTVYLAAQHHGLYQLNLANFIP